MSVLGTIARTCFTDASWFRVLRIDATTVNSVALSGPSIVRVEQRDVERAKCPLMRQQAQYGGDGTRLYGFIKDGEIVGLCCYWFGERYRTRNFWPLCDREAKLVQVITSPQMRGQRIATDLITESGMDMFSQGFSSLYARVWFSNKPSLRAFERSGWRPIAHAIALQTFGMKAPRKLIFKGR